MIKAAIYARTATKSQEETKEAILAQITRISDYSTSLGQKVDKIYDDNGYSGASLDRPALKRLLKDASERQFDVLYVKDISRLSRNLDMANILIKELMRYRVTIRFCEPSMSLSGL